MPMDSSLAPFGQVLRKLCLFEPLQSRESLPGTAVPGRCPGTAPHSNGHNSYLTSPIEVILSILESPRHELRKAHGLTLMPPSLRGWEAFPTPGALTHTRITWALSPTAPQVRGVTPGSPLCPWCFGHSSWRGARQGVPPRLGGSSTPQRRLRMDARPTKSDALPIHLQDALPLLANSDGG